MEIIKINICHDCGSNCDTMEVIRGKIKVTMCGDCFDKESEKSVFEFSELSDKAKSKAVYSFVRESGWDFDDTWEWLEETKVKFDIDGDIIDEE